MKQNVVSRVLTVSLILVDFLLLSTSVLLVLKALVVERDAMLVQKEKAGQRVVLVLDTAEPISDSAPSAAQSTAVKKESNKAPVSDQESVKSKASTKDTQLSPQKDKKEQQKSPAAEKADLSTPKTGQKAEKVPVAAASTAIRRKGPKIALVIGGLGLSYATTEKILALPETVTLGFSPYAHEAARWAEQAISEGHEVLVHMPLEPNNYPIDNPGPYALLTDLKKKENMKRLDWVLSRLKRFKGVYTHADEKFSLSLQSMRPVLKRFKKDKLLFVYGGGGENNALVQFAHKIGYSIIVNDEMIDAVISPDTIETSLRQLEEQALQQGSAIGIGSPYPVTARIVKRWITTLPEKGIQLVPVSALWKPAPVVSQDEAKEKE